MPGHRTTSLGKATPAGRTLPWIAALLAAGVALSGPAAARRRATGDTPASLARPSPDAGPAQPGPASVAPAAKPTDAAPDPVDAAAAATGADGPATAAPPARPAPDAGPLGTAVGLLDTRHPKSRARSSRTPAPMPGCTGMATLDGVSAALQAGPFGRRKGLAIMQFRNVVTDGETDDRVACGSDVLLSDGSLHRAQYDLRRARHGMRLRIEVAHDRIGATTAADAPDPRPPAPASGAAGGLPTADRPGSRSPAT